MSDPVNRPAHYTAGKIECIDAIASALSPEEFRGFLRGQVIKYVWRANHKGRPAEDHRKAGWYLDLLIGLEADAAEQKAEFWRATNEAFAADRLEKRTGEGPEPDDGETRTRFGLRILRMHRKVWEEIATYGPATVADARKEASRYVGRADLASVEVVDLDSGEGDLTLECLGGAIARATGRAERADPPRRLDDWLRKFADAAE